MLIVHHGLFWKSRPAPDRRRARRPGCRACSTHDLSLVAYHLALDAHPEVGNNALICQALGLDTGSSRSAAGEPRSASSAALDEPLPISPSADRARARAGHPRRRSRSPAGPSAVESVAVVSRRRRRIARRGRRCRAPTCFITGEPNEPAMARAARGGDPLHRRRPLRHRGVRRHGRWGAGFRPIRRRAPLHRPPESRAESPRRLTTSAELATCGHGLPAAESRLILDALRTMRRDKLKPTEPRSVGFFVLEPRSTHGKSPDAGRAFQGDGHQARRRRPPLSRAGRAHLPRQDRQVPVPAVVEETTVSG